MAESLTWREAAKAFWAGLTKPSTPALVGTILVSVLVFSACLLFLDEDFLASDGIGYLYDDHADEYAYLTGESLRLARAAPLTNHVFYFGTSILREAISNGGELTDLLHERTDRRFDVSMLAAGGATFWEMAVMLDQFAAGGSGVVVLPISPSVLAIREERLQELVTEPRLALGSPFLEGEAAAAGLTASPPEHDVFFLEHFRFFVPRLDNMLVNLVKGPIRDRHHFTDTRPPTDVEWARGVEWRSSWIETYPARKRDHLKAFRRLLDWILGQGDYRIVLVESLRNPAATEEIMEKPGAASVYDGYLDDVRNLAAETGAVYVDPGKEMTLSPEDFIDTSHIRSPEARRRFTALLADHLASLVAPEE